MMTGNGPGADDSFISPAKYLDSAYRFICIKGLFFLCILPWDMGLFYSVSFRPSAVAAGWGRHKVGIVPVCGRSGLVILSAGLYCPALR
ncbi:hypothetical protein F4809DRAFT_616304 [Biscogniauxia mediterranea]|nr:hypothetical protein F4809DRAFT_616304 [Biscogniauxia mediterranea]